MNAPSPETKISRYFTWHEALWLPQWDRMADEADGFDEAVQARLVKLFSILDNVREMYGRPVRVHCAYRPSKYNELIHGAPGSAHEAAKDDDAAVDFDVQGITCDKVREALGQRMTELKICIEDLPGTNWVHIDTRYRNGWRLFKP